jgi:DNA topoisomerase-6 subunit B
MSRRKATAEEQVSLFDLETEEQEEAEESEPASRAKRNGKPKGERSGNAAQRMAGKQREISVSEFFTKNRHLLGFDNPRKALLTTVKEAVDNSLDACEEANSPKVMVKIEAETRLRSIADNGPGLSRIRFRNLRETPLRLKFHSLKQSRGQQGIGISAAGMYGCSRPANRQDH